METVGGGGVFVDDVVVDGADEDEAIENFGAVAKVLGDFDARDGGVDGVVSGSGDFFAVTFAFDVPGIDMGGTTAEPDEDAMFGFAFGVDDFFFFVGGPCEERGAERQGQGGLGGAVEEFAASGHK